MKPPLTLVDMRLEERLEGFVLLGSNIAVQDPRKIDILEHGWLGA